MTTTLCFSKRYEIISHTLVEGTVGSVAIFAS